MLTCGFSQPGAQGGIRTHTPLRGADFKFGFEAENPGLVNSFIQDRKSRGLSVRSLQFYLGYLTRLLRFTEAPLFELTKRDITNFLESLRCNPGGKHAYFRVIRAFYKWALEEELIERSPIDHMKAPKVPKPVRHTVKLDNISKLMESCECQRDQLVIAMLADTGLRLSELASVTLEDVDNDARIIKVWGKGARQRLVRYGHLTESSLAEHLEVSEPGPILLGLEAKGISSMLARLERKTGFKCNAHAFRRTFATESVRNGMNLFYVQSLLAHSSLTMTRIYAEQVNSEDAIKAYMPVVR